MNFDEVYMHLSDLTTSNGYHGSLEIHIGISVHA